MSTISTLKTKKLIRIAEKSVDWSAKSKLVIYLHPIQLLITMQQAKNHRV